MKAEEFPSYARSFLITKSQCLRKYHGKGVDDVVIWDDAPDADTIWPPDLRDDYLQYKAERDRIKKP